MTTSLTLIRPDDWHVHFRDDDMLPYTVPATAKHFGRALAMPNLKPPLTTLDALLAYRKRLLEAASAYPGFQPYMTFYINESILPQQFEAAQNEPFILGAKLYPAGATTNSEAGARSIKALYPLLDIMQAQDWVLQIHGEVVAGDIFDREAVFLDTVLKPLLRDFPKLRMVLEHVSTRAAVEFVTEAPDNLAATITPHHLLYNRNQLLAGGIRPHYYCLPILKRESDQAALQKAAISRNPKFFAGTDSAPHAVQQKECLSGCAGVYSAPIALSMYMEVFDALGALDKLDDFLSAFGARFYHLPRTASEITLVRKPFNVPKAYQMGDVSVVPAHSGQALQWSVPSE